jgi:hypothetical protein
MIYPIGLLFLLECSMSFMLEGYIRRNLGSCFCLLACYIMFVLFLAVAFDRPGRLCIESKNIIIFTIYHLPSVASAKIVTCAIN